WWCAPGQVSWLSDRPTPRAFPASRPVAFAGFVPDHSDGVAAVSHRLPWALSSTLGANDAQTVAESPRARNARQRRCREHMICPLPRASEMSAFAGRRATAIVNQGGD